VYMCVCVCVCVCGGSTWEGWLSGGGQWEMLVPDVSRVYRRPYVGLTQHMDLLAELFNRPRVTNVYVPYTSPHHRHQHTSWKLK